MAVFRAFPLEYGYSSGAAPLNLSEEQTAVDTLIGTSSGTKRKWSPRTPATIPIRLSDSVSGLKKVRLSLNDDDEADDGEAVEKRLKMPEQLLTAAEKLWEQLLEKNQKGRKRERAAKWKPNAVWLECLLCQCEFGPGPTVPGTYLTLDGPNSLISHVCGHMEVCPLSASAFSR